MHQKKPELKADERKAPLGRGELPWGKKGAAGCVGGAVQGDRPPRKDHERGSSRGGRHVAERTTSRLHGGCAAG